MISLLNKVFKKEKPLSYIIPEYHPTDMDTTKFAVKMSACDIFEDFEIDEMQIDKIYECL